MSEENQAETVKKRNIIQNGWKGSELKLLVLDSPKKIVAIKKVQVS